MKKLLRKKDGFTLIELLIVVAIIGIIAGIAIPNFLGARTKARVTRAFADMRAIADALEMYYVDNTTYPAVPDEEGDPIPGLSPTYMTSQPNDPFSGDVYRYYINATATAWLLVSNGPDGDEDVAEDAISWDDADRIAGQLGGSDGADEGYGFDNDGDTNDWYNPTDGATSPGDLGRGGP
jgi:general secretion pathway protein G